MARVVRQRRRREPASVGWRWTVGRARSNGDVMLGKREVQLAGSPSASRSWQSYSLALPHTACSTPLHWQPAAPGRTGWASRNKTPALVQCSCLPGRFDPQYFVTITGVTYVNLSQNGLHQRSKRPAHSLRPQVSYEAAPAPVCAAGARAVGGPTVGPLRQPILRLGKPAKWGGWDLPPPFQARQNPGTACAQGIGCE
jgi:hypothetical protein